MNELGDKINSTILAQSVDVSVVPWSGSGVFVDYEVSLPLSVYCSRSSSEGGELIGVCLRENRKKAKFLVLLN